MFRDPRKKQKKTNRSFGIKGEDLAAEYLQDLGYSILSRNYTGGGAEIDIIAADGETVVFVEVKRRSSDEYGNPVKAVTKKKQRQLVKAAKCFQIDNKLFDSYFRFDAIAVTGEENSQNSVDHFKGAFVLPVNH